MPLVAQLVVDALKANSVKHVFALSGDQILSVFECLRNSGIELIHTRHEAAAVHMADAYGRLTGKPGVALVTAGPGHCNTMSALLSANKAESPVVLLSGASSLSLRGQGDFQEIDQADIARSVTKAAWYAEDPVNLAQDVTRALKLATHGRPGTVSLSLPTDLLLQDLSRIQAKPPTPLSVTLPPTPKADDTSLQKIVQMLNEAKNPFIICGPAMTRGECWKICKKLQEITQIPVIPSQSARGVYDPELRRVPQLFGKADVVLLLGKQLDFTLQFGQKKAFAETCRFVQISVDQRF